MPYYEIFNILQLHCPKTGGTSLENTLREAEGNPHFNYAQSREKFENNHREWQEQWFYGYSMVAGREFALQHATLEQLERLCYVSKKSLLSQNTKIVIVVRNPFSRMVSEYKWRLLFGFKGTFDEMVEKAKSEKWYTKAIYNQHFLPQSDFINGIPLDHPNLTVIYFEHLNEAMENFFDELSQNYPEFKNLKLRNDNASQPDKKKWQEFYSEKSVAAVVEMYKKDFETFGYDKTLQQ